MKKVIVFFTLCIIFMVGFTTWYLIERFSYSKKYEYFEITNTYPDSILTVGLIGDSWVSNNELDSLLIRYLNEENILLHVISSSHPGARTKRIYQNLYENEKNRHSSKFIIESQPDYCIIIAGVNDAASQIGAKNYSYHTIQIITSLLHYNIKPIVVSLPEFGIIEFTESSSLFKKIRSAVSAYFNNNNEIDNITNYRNVLNKELITKCLIDSIILVNYDIVCDDYNRNLNLYRNDSHLSKEGNQKLAKVIADNIIKDIADDCR